METSEVVLVALIVAVPAALLWAIFLARTGRPGRPSRRKLGIPHAMRPAQPDEVLEGPRLERVQIWGVLSVLSLAIFIPAYWLPETQRQEHFQERFDEEAEHRGMLIYNQPPELPEGIGGVEFKQVEEASQLGQSCINCHGPEGAGGTAPYNIPGTEETVSYQAPPLNNVFTRWDEEIVEFTIKRGRPGTPMPAWGVEFGGPMTEQMVADVIAYLKSLPGNQEPPPELAEGATGAEIFEARCAVCHGPDGQGKEGEDMWYQGLALWQGDVNHLSEELHLQTVRNGRRFAFMPPFGEAPDQGVPVPLYPLTEEQIEAVIEYERGL